MKRLLVLALCTLGFTASNHIQAQKGDGSDGGSHPAEEQGDDSCPGCESKVHISHMVTVPGITIGIEAGNPNADGSPYNPNGKCKFSEDGCSQSDPCKPVIKHTYAASTTSVLEDCVWTQQPNGSWKWNCTVVNPGWSGKKKSHLETQANMACGSKVSRKTKLGAASVTWKMTCSECVEISS